MSSFFGCFFWIGKIPFVSGGEMEGIFVHQNDWTFLRFCFLSKFLVVFFHRSFCGDSEASKMT